MDDDDVVVVLKNKKRCRVEEEGIDRISGLSDDLIHLIFSYLDAQLAVQSSILSKRWRYVWKTLPFLNFKRDYKSTVTLTQFVQSFLRHRNRQHDIYNMKLPFSDLSKPPTSKIYKFITNAIQHNVQNLDVDIFSCTFVEHVTKLSTFSSNSLKELKLKLNIQIRLLKSDCWDLPVLTNLHWSWPYYRKFHKLRESYLICLPSLQTLFLDGFGLPNSITLPALTTLHLKACKIPQNFWNLPNLLNLTLDNVQLPKDLSLFFPTLVNLRNLTLFLQTNIVEDFLIKCPQLVNLEINTSMPIIISPSVRIIVLAPKICNFSSDGFFPITFGDSELENVNIKLQENIRYLHSAPSNKLKNYYRQAEQMFVGLGSAKILTLDLETIKALNSVSDVLVSSPSPFYNLKYVKVPPECKESCISAHLKLYLFGCCPEATIVTTVPQNDLIPRSKGISLTTQYVVDSENIPESVSVNTVDMGVKEKHMVQNSVIHAEGNDRVISFRGNSDFGLWRGHEVNSEFVCLLNLIINKYPETFEYFNAKGKRVSATKLNMLCTSINDFTKISLTEVNTEIIAEYRNIFAALQDLGFNLNWLLCCLNYLEQLWFMQAMKPQLHAIEGQIDETKNKSRDPQTIPPQQMKKIEKAFVAIGTNLAVGNIGDHLFSGP